MAGKKLLKRTVLTAFILLVIAGATGAYLLFANNVVDHEEPIELYVESDWTYDSLYDHLLLHVLKEPLSFNILAKRMNLPSHVYPGKYVIDESKGNYELIRFFRSAQTTDVKVLIRAGMQLPNVAAALAKSLAVDSVSMLQELENGEYINSLDFKGRQKLCLFLANTYSFNWASTPEAVVKRFEKEYQKFWNNTRLQRASALSLTPKEVAILASIVDGEVIFHSEMKTVAGVYLNRLRQDWALGADPTIKFIIQEEGRQRVLNRDLERDHPYNTYINKGLPPGPIGLPSAKAIEAVLDAEQHNYMYFCAKADLSGYHHFSVSGREHNRYAAAYHRAMDARGIMR